MTQQHSAPGPGDAHHRGEGDGNRPGDKMRVCSGQHKGARGLLVEGEGERLRIQTEAGGVIVVGRLEVTNASLAARQSWREKPKKGAGRPRHPVPRKKMVSFRIEVALWDDLGRAAQLGLIKNKEHAVNTWLRALADMLSSQIAERKANDSTRISPDSPADHHDSGNDS